MKKTILSICLLLTIFSCKTDEQYEELNIDPKNPSDVPASFLFNSATKSLFDQMASTNVNRNIYRLFAQYWTQTTYTDESNFDLNNRNIPDYHWSEMYRDVLYDLKKATEAVDASTKISEDEKLARKAQIDILSVFTWQQLVDTFGDIPYSEALNTENTLPKYDDGLTIYKDLISRIDVALSNIEKGGFTSSDKMYNGNSAKWKLFANSLKLRLAIRLVDTDADLAKKTANEAVNSGVFNSSADDAKISYLSAAPNTNPLWVDLVQSGRSDFVPANTIVDIMNNLEDPRRKVYFSDNLGENNYVGGIYGANNSYSAYSHIGKAMLNPELSATILSYSEVEFYLAQAAEMSVVGNPSDAEMHYNNAIRASFETWGVSKVDEYLSKENVAYATAKGNWKEKIGTQFWLAMYNRGFAGWTVWRTFDYPEMNIPESSKNPVPYRYSYPIDEQNLNTSNYKSASEKIGGDKQATKIFWDKN